MVRSLALVSAALLALLFSLPAPAADERISLDVDLQKYLSPWDLPAVAAAVVKDGKIVAAGAAGTRRAGSTIPVTINDRFHLGSDTKAMTAVLAAQLVEANKLRWSSTVAEVFPELTKTMDAGLRTVTLEQLLSHTSGIPSDNDATGELYGKAMQQEGNLDELRLWLVKQWVREPLASKPGEKFAYSNLGYVLVGAMLERLTGKTWDELITERIFVPLELKTAGLGCQASLGRVDAPLGHRVIEGKLKAFLAGPNGDSPYVLGPAGIAHLSVLDFATWAAWNAGGGRRGPKLIQPETLDKLQTPVVSIPSNPKAPAGTPFGGRYALGWAQFKVSWAPEPILFHGGSNDMNLAHVWIDRKRDHALVLLTNVSGKKTEQGLFTLATDLHARFLKKP